MISNLIQKTPGLSQYAIKKFAESFEVVPRTLADNAGLDSTQVISKLYAAHQQQKVNVGVDIEVEQDGVMDVAAKNIFDALSSKKNALRLATDAALNVLRVDQIIMSKPAGGPKVKKPQFNDDD
jgi:T-complex protein 1 subunit theta